MHKRIIGIYLHEGGKTARLSTTATLWAAFFLALVALHRRQISFVHQCLRSFTQNTLDRLFLLLQITAISSSQGLNHCLSINFAIYTTVG
jgi:hypothetical protein